MRLRRPPAPLPTVSAWTDPPEFGLAEEPALLVEAETRRLWLAYPRAADDAMAVVRFSGVIDHRLSPINDEGLGEHRYARAGLAFYAFNVLEGSEETRRWSVLGARHWVITFKDHTLDVVARSAGVAHRRVDAASPLEALSRTVSGAQD